MYAGDFHSYAFQQIISLLLRHMPTHIYQHMVADMLQCDIEIFANIIMTLYNR